MPVFEYKCVDCGKISEFLVNAGGNTPKGCSHCGGKKLEKQFSVFAPRIKEGQSKKCHGCSDHSCPHSSH